MEYLATILPVNTFLLYTATRAGFSYILSNIHARIFIKAHGSRFCFASARAVRKPFLWALYLDIRIVSEWITVV
jgi:hypothetical protein